jgi:hypothetical protein
MSANNAGILTSLTCFSQLLLTGIDHAAGSCPSIPEMGTCMSPSQCKYSIEGFGKRWHCVSGEISISRAGCILLNVAECNP